MIKNIFITILAAIILAGCAGSSYNYKVNTKPYTINGTTYYPMSSANGFSETGTASWYGPDFHGKKTASGETYNKYAFTAAHKTLPFGTKVKVTNLNNNLSTTVVINDRGPFKSGRIIDLSYSAAQKISMVGTGTARVRIEAIGSTISSSSASSASTTTTTKSSSGTSSGKYYVQVAAYSVRDNANSTAVKLSGMGYSKTIRQSNGKYTVLAGPYSTRASAESARDKLRNTYSGAFIVE